MSKALFRTQRNFPSALSIRQNPKEPVRIGKDHTYLYPARNIVTTRHKGHRYYLVLWRDQPGVASGVGMDYQQTYRKLRYVVRRIVFYFNPKTKYLPHYRYGLYIRMER